MELDEAQRVINAASTPFPRGRPIKLTLLGGRRAATRRLRRRLAGDLDTIILALQRNRIATPPLSNSPRIFGTSRASRSGADCLVPKYEVQA
jgi:hypothetical protein